MKQEKPPELKPYLVHFYVLITAILIATESYVFLELLNQSEQVRRDKEFAALLSGFHKSAGPDSMGLYTEEMQDDPQAQEEYKEYLDELAYQKANQFIEEVNKKGGTYYYGEVVSSVLPFLQTAVKNKSHPAFETSGSFYRSLFGPEGPNRALIAEARTRADEIDLYQTLSLLAFLLLPTALAAGKTIAEVKKQRKRKRKNSTTVETNISDETPLEPLVTRDNITADGELGVSLDELLENQRIPPQRNNK